MRDRFFRFIRADKWGDTYLKVIRYVFFILSILGMFSFILDPLFKGTSWEFPARMILGFAIGSWFASSVFEFTKGSYYKGRSDGWDDAEKFYKPYIDRLFGR